MIIIIILIITIFIILRFFIKESFIGSFFDEQIKPEESEVYISDKELSKKNITFDSKLYLLINKNKYLNVGINCPRKIVSDSCFKTYSKEINELVYTYNKQNLDNTLKTGLWHFINIKSLKDKNIYYGQEIYIKSLSNSGGYICICESAIQSEKSCNNMVSLYVYNDIKDAEENGSWIIIPSINDYNNIEVLNNTNFYDEYANNSYNFNNLYQTKIPVNLKHNFYIISKKLIDDKHIYLNLCSSLRNNDCDDNIYTYTCVGTFNNINNKLIIDHPPRKLTKTDNKITHNNQQINKNLTINTISVEPIKYNIDIHDTLFVKGTLNLGNYEITAKTLRAIKSIPYHFKDNLCLKNQDNKDVCINKTHIEMLNGSRPINIQSIAPLKPVTLYSRPYYRGRKLKIGYDYMNLKDLPFIKNRNKWLNPRSDGKWFSIKVDRNHKLLIFSESNFGFDDSDQNSTEMEFRLETLQKKLEQNMMNLESNAKTNDNTNTNTKSKNIDLSNNKMQQKITYKQVEYPGINDVRKLGGEWSNGIRSIKFLTEPDFEFAKKCLGYKNFYYQPNTDKNRRTNKQRKHLFAGYNCKNGKESQQFYLLSDKNTNLDNYYIGKNHIDFHKHDISEYHD